MTVWRRHTWRSSAVPATLGRPVFRACRVPASVPAPAHLCPTKCKSGLTGDPSLLLSSIAVSRCQIAPPEYRQTPLIDKFIFFFTRLRMPTCTIGTDKSITRRMAQACERVALVLIAQSRWASRCRTTCPDASWPPPSPGAVIECSPPIAKGNRPAPTPAPRRPQYAP